MSIVDIPLYNVVSLDDYWIRLEKSLENYLPLLKHKHEYGTSDMCSEYGIQISLASYAEKIARQLNINSHMTKCICMGVGLCFPEFGSYGMLACEKYIAKNKIPLTKNELKISTIEYCIYKICAICVTFELDEALHAYYENKTNIPEVNVARYCQKKLKENRALMKTKIFAGEAIQKIMDSTENCFSIEKTIIEDNDINIDIPSEIQERVNTDLDMFIEYEGFPEGIFNYIIL